MIETCSNLDVGIISLYSKESHENVQEASSGQ